MQTYASRGGRWSLARTIVILAAVSALGACAGETTAPALDTPSHAAANAAAPSPEPYTATVDLVVERVADSPVYGTTVRIGVTCSTSQVFDLIVDLEQRVKTDGGNQQLVQGSSTWSAYPCDQGKTSVIFAVSSTHPKLDFRPGRGKVRARIENYQPGVQPADITTRVRIVADER